MIYLVCFVLTSLLVYCLNNKRIVFLNDSRSYDSSYIALILPVTLAALRATSIGVDVENYVTVAFNRVSGYDSFIDVVQNHSLEIGYETIVYIVTRFTSDLHWLHFVTAFIVLFGAYNFICQFKNKASVIVMLVTFFSFYYNQSFNIVRQWIAIGIYLFAVKYMLRKKPLQYFILCLAALACHQSAIIVFPIYFIYWYVNSDSLMNDDKRLKRMMLIVVAICVFAVLFPTIVNAAVEIGILPAKYSHYLTDESGQASLYMILLSKVPFVAGAMILYRRLINKDKNNQAIILFVIIDCILSLLSVRFGYASRIAEYFGVWGIVFIGKCYEEAKQIVIGAYGRIAVGIFFYGFLAAYWIYCYAIRGFSGTYPYVSDVLTFLNW